MEKLRKAEELLLKAERGLLIAALAVMVTLSFSQVVLRQFFGTGILWADTLLRHLVLLVGFLGAALAAADGKNFAFELSVHQDARPSWRALLADIAASIITIFLVRAGWSFYHEERESAGVLFTAGAVTVPAWLFAGVIPLGFLLVLTHTALRATRNAATLLGPKP